MTQHDLGRRLGFHVPPGEMTKLLLDQLWAHHRKKPWPVQCCIVARDTAGRRGLNLLSDRQHDEEISTITQPVLQNFSVS